MHTVYMTGAWDLLHIGHVRALERARALGDILVVGVMSDEFVEASKGDKPVIPCEQRLEMIRSLRCVDFAGVVTGHTDYHLLDLFAPDVRAVGPDYGEHPGHEWALVEMGRRGIEVVMLPKTLGVSTTAIEERITKERITANECCDRCGCGMEGRRVASGPGEISGCFPAPG